MKVFGYAVSDSALAHVSRRMRECRTFSTNEAVRWFVEAGVPSSRDRCWTAAERVLQQERKAGRIRRCGRVWTAVMP